MEMAAIRCKHPEESTQSQGRMRKNNYSDAPGYEVVQQAQTVNDFPSAFFKPLCGLGIAD